jgi:peptidoglycan hydrolase-like protein with peptidoglycan-binding domain
LQNELGQLSYTIPTTETQGSSFGAQTLAAVRAFQTAQNLTVTGEVDAATAAALTAIIVNSTHVATGTVSSPSHAAVGVLSVQLVDKNIGGDVTAAATTTAADGTYKVSAVISPATLRARHKTRADLQARVSSRTGNAPQAFLAASAVSYDAPNSVTLNVALPGTASGLPSEHETLTGVVAQLYTGDLSKLQETAQQQDLTFLANKSGWDARTVAMAALAEQFSQTMTAPANVPAAPTGQSPTTTGAAAIAPPPPPPPVSLQPEFYYALFRAGVPAGADQIFRTNPTRASAIWKQAIDQGVIPASLTPAIPAATQAFQTLARISHTDE